MSTDRGVTPPPPGIIAPGAARLEGVVLGKGQRTLSPSAVWGTQ